MLGVHDDPFRGTGLRILQELTGVLARTVSTPMHDGAWIDQA